MSIVTTMLRRSRFLSWLALAGFAVWLGRLIAHSKVPSPEGLWRELTPEELE